MLCPYCGQETHDGADQCDACQHSLTDVVVDSGDSTATVEKQLLVDTLEKLEPQQALTVTSSTQVKEVIKRLAEQNIGCALVVDDGQLVGIFTERDALMKIGMEIDRLGNKPVQEFMTPSPERLTAETSVAFAMNRMAVGHYRHIPVEFGGDRPWAVISARDILSYLTEEFPSASSPLP